MVAVADSTGTSLWDTARGQTLRTFERPGIQGAFSSDGATLAIAGEDGSIRLFDAVTGQPRGAPLTARSEVTGLTFSFDGVVLAATYQDGQSVLWDTRTGDSIATLAADRVVFGPGRLLAATGESGIALWNLAPSSPISSTLAVTELDDMRFSADGAVLNVAARRESQLTLESWMVATRQISGTVAIGSLGDLRSTRFTDDGATLVAVFQREEGLAIERWDVEDRQRRGEPTISPDPATALAISPNGTALALGRCTQAILPWQGCDLSEIALLDLESRQRLDTPLKLAFQEIESLQFSPDGTLLVAYSGSRQSLPNRMTVWNLDVEAWRGRACATAGRNLTWTEWQRYVGSAPYQKTCLELPVHPSLIEAGRALARAGKIGPARDLLARVAELEPGLGLDPEAEAHSAAAEGALTIGATLAEQGKIDEALAAFQQATIYSPTLRIPADSWHALCRWGSLWGRAADVLDTCDRAVAGGDGRANDSRAIARALTGDLPGAIADLRIFITWAAERDYSGLVATRQGWIDALERRRNPFDTALLEQLRSEPLPP